MRTQAHKLFDDEKLDRRCMACGIVIDTSCIHDPYCFGCKPEVLHERTPLYVEPPRR